MPPGVLTVSRFSKKNAAHQHPHNSLSLEGQVEITDFVNSRFTKAVPTTKCDVTKSSSSCILYNVQNYCLDDKIDSLVY